MWHVTLRNKGLKTAGKENKKQIAVENKDEPLEVGWKDILAMIIAAFQILTPVILLGGTFITLIFVAFYLITK